MPVYLKNTFIERIPLKTLNIRRIYNSSKELLYGLFDIIYWDRGNAYKALVDELKKWYAWGKNRELPSIVSNNTNFKDYFQTYRTHYDAWYKDHKYVNIMPIKQVAPLIQYIDADTKEDLTLYAKWRQKKFSYKGTYQWQESGSIGTRTTKPGTSDIDVKNYGSGVGILMPNCTAYVRGRCNELGWNQPTYSTGDAISWVTNTINAVGENVDDGNGWKAYLCSDISQLQPGDIGCGGTGQGHVFFVEGDWSATGSYWTTNSSMAHNKSTGEVKTVTLPRTSGYKAVYNTIYPGLSNWYYQVDGKDKSTYDYRWWHSSTIADEYKNGCKSVLIGYLRYSNATVTKTNDASGDCSNQNNPSFPDAPKGSWISKKYITKERQFNYNKDGSGSWGNWDYDVSKSSQWNESW